MLDVTRNLEKPSALAVFLVTLFLSIGCSGAPKGIMLVEGKERRSE